MKRQQKITMKVIQACLLAGFGFSFSQIAVAANTAINSTQSFTIMDFDDSVLHDESWALSQTLGSKSIYVKPKKDSGADSLTLAVGQGLNGSNALKVEASASTPGFFVIKQKKTSNNALSRFYDEEGYFLPSGKKANRMEFWLKFPQPGYRVNNGAAQPPQYPNHNNFVLGTYHYDQNLIGNGGSVVESDGWHFYHQIWLRHDKANNGWIHVVLNQQPQHKRSVNKTSVPNNPTLASGNYWELLTRFYMDGLPYYADQEIPYPVTMLVDDIKLSYVPESVSVKIDFTGHQEGDTLLMTRGVKNTLPITVKNLTGSQVCGKLAVNTKTSFGGSISDGNGNKLAGSVCLNANSTNDWYFSMTPDSGAAFSTIVDTGISFVKENQVLTDSQSVNRSLNDSNVEKRWQTETGPHDAIVNSSFVRVKMTDQVVTASTNSVPNNTSGGTSSSEDSEVTSSGTGDPESSEDDVNESESENEEGSSEVTVATVDDEVNIETEEILEELDDSYEDITSEVIEQDQADSVSQQEQIEQLLALVKKLQIQLAKLQNDSDLNLTIYEFTKAFTNGDEDTAVYALQQKLNKNGFTVATEGAGSPGQETNHYGPRTTKAIQKFQCQYDIICTGDPESTGYGNFGPLTRERIMEL